jgi:uncharacterized repeat protein (TIGR03803 family)
MQSHRLVAGVRWAITLFLVIVVYASSALAVTEKVLHSFSGSPDGADPAASLVLDGLGNLYGTTYDGGAFGYGTVFELTRSEGWTEKILYSFGAAPDGENPRGGLVFDKAGNLYGTTEHGGPFSGEDGYGTVFELSPSEAGWTEEIIYDFGNSSGDGCFPVDSLTIDSLGNLYGTTANCGVEGGGTVFELSPSSGAWSETILWAFNFTDGDSPEGGVVFDSAGNLYGTTYAGGFYAGGNVYKLFQESGDWTETSIFSFTGGDNGCYPDGSVILDKAGNLYGTTSECGADDVGTVFKVTPTQEGQWTMSILHTFTGGTDGGRSAAGLIFDSVGNLYGTTFYGGLFGNGTVFSLTPKKGGKWTEAEYSFVGGPDDGANPYAGVILGSGAVFGTTSYGGASGQGTVYEITAK